jgi:phospholipid/cholesterol/gamma-HCH transport system substrate-binding protein
VATANRVIDQVGTDVTDFTGRLEPLTATAGDTLEAATATFHDASATLARLDSAMGVAERTLTAAEGTFTEANRIIGEEVAPTAADIRTAAAELGSAVSKVSADLPEITGELRTTLARATEAIGSIEAVVAASAPPIRDFATTGLPQFTRFTIEARGLIARLDRIADRLERDPARFLLGGQAPDYRR